MQNVNIFTENLIFYFQELLNEFNQNICYNQYHLMRLKNLYKYLLESIGWISRPVQSNSEKQIDGIHFEHNFCCLEKKFCAAIKFVFGGWQNAFLMKIIYDLDAIRKELQIERYGQHSLATIFCFFHVIFYSKDEFVANCSSKCVFYCEILNAPCDDSHQPSFSQYMATTQQPSLGIGHLTFFIWNIKLIMH